MPILHAPLPLRLSGLLVAGLLLAGLTHAQPQVGTDREGTAVQSGIAFSPDGTQLASVDKRNRIALWDVETGALRRTIPGQARYMYALDWSPDGTRIASASMDGTVAVWDVASGRRVQSVGALTAASNRMAGGVLAVAFAPDGRHVAGIQALPTGELVVWRVADGAEVMRVTQDRSFGDVAWTADGTGLRTVEFDGGLYDWSFPNGRVLGKRALDPKQLTTLDGTGSLLATGGEGDVVYLVDPTRDTVRHRLPHDAYVNRVAVLPDRSAVASVDGDGILKVWDAATGSLRVRRRAHVPLAYSVAAHPTGRLLATAGQDSIIRLWDATTGALVREIRGE
jgi:WD40 repeat protein